MPQPSANKRVHSGFESWRRRLQKSKTGVSVAPQMDMCQTKKNVNKVVQSGFES